MTNNVIPVCFEPTAPYTLALLEPALRHQDFGRLPLGDQVNAAVGVFEPATDATVESQVIVAARMASLMRATTTMRLVEPSPFDELCVLRQELHAKASNFFTDRFTQKFNGKRWPIATAKKELLLKSELVSAVDYGLINPCLLTERLFPLLRSHGDRILSKKSETVFRGERLLSPSNTLITSSAIFLLHSQFNENMNVFPIAEIVFLLTAVGVYALSSVFNFIRRPERVEIAEQYLNAIEEMKNSIEGVKHEPPNAV